MRINRTNKMILTALTLLCLSAPVFAADPVTPEGSGQAGDGEPQGGSVPHLEINKAELEENGGQILIDPEMYPGLQGLDANQSNTLMSQIRVVMAASDMQLAELQARLDSETSNRNAMEIIKQMELIKVQTELDILASQASFARQNGREEVALEIEGVLEAMTAPRPVRQPVDRSAPAAGNR